MALSIRAAELLHELDQTVAQLESHASAIAAELAEGINGDEAAILRAMRHIGILFSRHRDFAQKVKEGPDAPPSPGARATYPVTADWTTLEHKARDHGHSIGQWPLVHQFINRLIRFDTEALYPEMPPRTDALCQINTASDDVWKMVHAALNPNAQDPDAKEAGGFADIPLPQSAFLSHLQAAARVSIARKSRDDARFLDVGCGGGLKVLSATRYFNHSDGLEFDPGYVATAQNLMQLAGLSNSAIHTADALKFDGYGDYDIIYFYRPLKDDAKLQQLEQRIATHAPAKALLIAPYEAFGTRYEELNCGKIAGQLYLTQSTDEEARALRLEAEIIAPHMPPGTFRFAPLWQPIGTAVRQRTFH